MADSKRPKFDSGFKIRLLDDLFIRLDDDAVGNVAMQGTLEGGPSRLEHCRVAAMAVGKRSATTYVAYAS